MLCSLTQCNLVPANSHAQIPHPPPGTYPHPLTYPFTVPTIASLKSLAFLSRVTFFTGENGAGKSTLLEAIAAHIGFGREGGNRNFNFETSDSSRAAEPLARALRLGFFPARTGEGFYFRAESLFNAATFIDQSDAEQVGLPGRPIVDSFGGVSLHTRSHGETFFTVLDHKFRRSGLFLLDEPEAALSPPAPARLPRPHP